MRDSLYPAEKEQCDREGRDVYLLMDEQAASVELGCQGLLFHPYLLGERCPYFNPNARGDFFGVSMVHKKGILPERCWRALHSAFMIAFRYLRSLRITWKIS